MIPFKINKIYIENFKLFDNAEIDFKENNLIVLDGPNGFGKTTIFDSIELVLTGQISRITNNRVIDEREGCDDILLCKVEGKDMVVKAEFANEEQIFTLARIIDCTSKNYSRLQKRPTNWELFDVYISDSFDLNEKRSISQAEIDTLFKEDMQRFYSLFYYIQQEDNTYFLKKSEKDRMKILSVLFDTRVEVEEKEKLSRFRKRLESIKKNVSNNIAEKEDLLKSRVENQLKNVDGTLEEIEYKQLFPWLKPGLQWDQNELIIKDRALRDSYNTELHDIRSFIAQYNLYKLDLKNQEFENRAEDSQIIKDTIIGELYFTKFNEIKRVYEKQEILERLLKSLISKKAEDLIDIDFAQVGEFRDLPLNVNECTSKIRLIKNYYESADHVSGVIRELNSTRENLKESFLKAVQYGINNKQCPLCGQDWGDYSNLLLQIDEKTKIFSTYYDEATNSIEKEITYLYESQLNTVVDWLTKYLQLKENIISEELYKQILNSYSNKEKIEKFIQWNRDNEIIEVMDYNNKMNDQGNGLDECIKIFQQHIKDKRIVLSDEYLLCKKEYNFDRVFREIFCCEEKNIATINIEDIDRKIRYIDYIYYNSSVTEVDELRTALSDLKSQKKNITEISKNVKAIIDLYSSRISEHWSGMIKNIEIPFYIYSGKIIQDHQRGQGIFIKESNELEKIRFLSNNKTDHDALCSLSSGQLSALVIAFTLALNKVYGNKGFNTMLIDDPVQTMDDVNMASLVEVLRNEFSNKQLIFSTHEEDVSLYLRYKFKKYGLKTVSINVKEKFRQLN